MFPYVHLMHSNHFHPSILLLSAVSFPLLVTRWVWLGVVTRAWEMRGGYRSVGTTPVVVSLKGLCGVTVLCIEFYRKFMLSSHTRALLCWQELAEHTLHGGRGSSALAVHAGRSSPCVPRCSLLRWRLKSQCFAGHDAHGRCARASL